MRNQFFRLFLSIILIIIAVLLTQVFLLMAINVKIKSVWADEVMNEFADSIEKSIYSFKSSSSDSVLNLMVQSSSERISGLIVRDANGDVALTLGFNSRGIPVPQLTSSTNINSYYTAHNNTGRFKASVESENSTVTYSLDSPKYEIALSTVEAGDSKIVTDIEFNKLANSRKSQLVVYPSTIKKADVAGSVLITMNGEPSVYIDVIAYNLDYYNPTKFVVYNLLKGFSCTIPVAILISILLAYYVSKRNERVVRDIQKALDELSEGQYNVSLPATKIEEYEDITKSIYKLAKDLKRHGESRKEWIKNISHDLNTPVTSMNLLLNGAVDGIFPINDTLISAIKSENDTLKSRISSVTYYSYLLSPDAKCEKTQIELINAADEVLQSGGYNIKLEFPPELTLCADPALLSRALLEIVKNAVSYKSDDSSPLFKAEQTPDKTIITVENHGTLPDPLPQFFEPWARGDQSRTGEGGSGLGLSIVYQIMELHGGTVSIKENDGVVKVTLEFPAS